MIPQSFNEAFERVSQLASVFKANEHQYLSASYSEAQARTDFIDKFWVALGWDVYHEKQTNPYEQEVKIERGVTMSAGRKRADYAFLAPNFRDVLFYVEAKKPKAEIDNSFHYFQTIRYGWNGRTPLAVLTDFEQFRVLDCRYKPDFDTALQRAVKKFYYADYFDPEKFADLYYLFSREATREGALKKYADTLEKPSSKARQRTLFGGGFKDIDESFLEDLDEYREELAQSFARENPQLNGYELTEVTQRTLDRLVFMRFLEDKLIEPDPLVENLGNSGSAWQGFVAASRRLDRIYNGIIFKKHALLDAPTFRVDETAFDGVRASLAHSISPYDFNAIPIHILGSIYERFLGKIITVTDKGAQVEEKPEVRKAGGVYYTPEYIVRYIVENTVGQLLDGKSPEDVRRMRFADIACGSGSFLLGVYDLLLRFHTGYYNSTKANKAKGRKAGCIEHEDGSLHLSLLQRRDILLNNIYGVDVDPQAVEVAQLSLYLKLLEDENVATAKKYQMEFREALLPTLNNNIVCGNSLIGWDILEGHLFEPEEEHKLNPMEFKSAFAQVMEGGGFDAIVGNPPYVRIQGFPRKQIDYLSKNYRSAVGNFDLYVAVVERAYNLLKEGGRMGQILPNKFFKTDYGLGLRRLISENQALAKIVDFGAEQVFDASTYTCLLFLSKDQKTTFSYTQSEANEEALNSATFVSKRIDSVGMEAWSFVDDLTTKLFDKLERKSIRLLGLPAEMSRGSSSGDDEVFMIGDSEVEVEEGILRMPIFASDFSRYSFNPVGEWRIIFPYVQDSGGYRLYTERELEQSFPKAYAYLLAHREKLEKRKQYKAWYGYSAPRNLLLHDRAQLLVPLLANHGMFTFIPEATQGSLCLMASGGFSVTLSGHCPVNPKYLLGVLNSKLLFWKLRELSNIFRGGWITCTKQYFGELPIRTINFGDPGEIAQHDRMVRLVEHMLTSKQQLASAHADRDRNFYERKCADLDRQIDGLVYELYELTDEEVSLVEAGE
jgi:type I restriction-modification system DNA methylase subunit